MHRLLILALALPCVIGCKDTSETAPAPTTAPASPTVSPAAQEAQSTFKTICSVCHGLSGTGDGVGAAQLDPNPRDHLG